MCSVQIIKAVYVYAANLATAVGSLLFFISYIPYLFLQPHYDSTGCLLKVIACFLSNVAMAFGAHVIGEHESSGEQILWKRCLVVRWEESIQRVSRV